MSTLRSSDHVIVIGAGLAGWRLVTSLRDGGFQGAITLVGDESYAPYDRPPLSKQILSGKWDIDKATLASTDQLVEARVTLLLGQRATKLDVAMTSIQLADGSEITGTHVVLATGSKARPLSFPSSGPLATLRTYDDLLRLRGELESLEPQSTVAIIGGGFVGAEVATSLKARGFTPVVLEAAARPLMSVLGEQVAMWLQRISRDSDIELRTDQRLVDVTKTANGLSLEFEDGSRLVARAALAAIGSMVDLEWLGDSGLFIDDGVVVNSDLQGAPRVAAIGDVARFQHRSVVGEELLRVEHWQLATEHAAQLAHFWISGERSRALLIPYFWSDQYGKKLQMLGHPSSSDDVTRVSGSPEEGKWLALYSRGDLVSGVVSLNQPRGLMLSKTFLESPTLLADALARAPWKN